MEMRLFIVTAFLLASVTASAQTWAFQPGIRGGVSSFNIKNFIGDNHLGGFTTGIYHIKPISTHFDFQPELNFQRQGSQSNYTANMGDIAGIKFKDTYKLNYLNIPLLIGYRIPKSVLKIYAGPQAGFLLSAKLIHQPENYETTRTDIKDNLNTFAVSGAYGISVTLPAGNRNAIVVDGRFSNEFTHLDKGSGPDYGKNYGYTITVGYSF